MAWPGIHTWVVGDAWPVTDANAYISNALASVRRYQNSSGLHFGETTGGNIATASETQVGPSHFNLMTTTPDENYRMIVIVDVNVSTSSGGAQPANSYTINVYDQLGGVLAGRLNNIQGNWNQDITAVGGAPYSSGQNNGFRVTIVPGAATNLFVTWSGTAFFYPAV